MYYFITCNLFTDDTAIYRDGNSTVILQTDVDNAIKLFQDNILTTNIDKSYTLTVGIACRLAHQINDLNITTLKTFPV